MTNSDDEEFHDSLDRILSSSCSSTSASEDDAEPQRRRRRRRSGDDPSMYDIWVSQPSSVAERRRRLLWQMGLLSGSSSAWKRNQGEEEEEEEEEEEDENEGAVIEDRTERFAVCEEQQNSRLKPVSFPGNDDGSRSIREEEHRIVGSPGSDREDSNKDEPKCDKYFTIKNLNNGERFVVKEVREDGMWKRLREVETGRQFTMEEFQSSVIGLSPIVQELMRRQSVEEDGGGGGITGVGKREIACPNGVTLIGDRWMMKKKGRLLRGLKTVVQRLERRKSADLDTSTTDDSQGARLNNVPRRIKVRQCGSSTKNLTALYMSQEIQAHVGSIWTVKFSVDGRYLASAGEDRVIRVWQVMETNMDEWLPQEVNFGCFSISGDGYREKLADPKQRAKGSALRKSLSFERILVPEHVFALSEKPVRSFHGHLKDVLDLSWSASEYLLSSSMDKTVRLWHMSCNACLKVFAHSDYVTCIQFNPINDNYFISGSLDAKVRIWSIQDRHVIDWSDLREMITAVCYRPDGEAALVGSHKGGCYEYDTSDNKLHRRGQISLQNKKKSHHKKITGFQFAPGRSSEVLITSADSRIRVVNGLDSVYKFRGMRNTSSQIAASFTADGQFVISPSEDSHVCVWKYDVASWGGRRRVNRTYEHFHCREVTAAVPWCGPSSMVGPGGRRHERGIATWPEEKLVAAGGGGGGSAPPARGSAWGMVIVAASRGGDIRAFQNFGSLSPSIPERK
ncbi:uncharacterized protein LOC144699940 isoform X2 [Wolffia australiana]